MGWLLTLLRTVRLEVEEPLTAGYRATLALTGALGAVVSIAAFVADAPLLGAAGATLTVLVAIGAVSLGNRVVLAGWITVIAGYAGMLLWFGSLLQFPEEAIVVPAGMAALCAAGASLFWSELEDRKAGERPAPSQPTEPPADQPSEGWIEEDGRRIPD